MKRRVDITLSLVFDIKDKRRSIEHGASPHRKGRPMAKPVHAAIIGSGNIGTDLMIKMLRGKGLLKITALVGIDPQSDGLRRAESMGVAGIATGVDGLIASPEFETIDIVFDATSASAHRYNATQLQAAKPGIRLIDLTPAAIGPYCIAAVNLEEHIDALNLNMVTCGGQATIPMVAAVASVVPVRYAEIVASISSKSAGPGTRANIDEFTETTADAIQKVGGAEASKALIILNPAEPPLLMRDTVFTLTADADRDAIQKAVAEMVQKVQSYVPGYRLKQNVQFDEITTPVNVPGIGEFTGLKTSIFLEVEGAAHYLPAYAGNLDIMTSAALRAGETIALRAQNQEEAA
jgi:acetaldehyde dehydrogenase